LVLEQIDEIDMVKLHLSKIKSSAARMSALINDILQFSQANEGRHDVETIDLNKLLVHVKEDFELLIQQEQAKVESDSLPVVQANRIQITQLFSNLISNALKFTDQQPQITVHYKEVNNPQVAGEVSLDANKNYHYLRFSDNGIGFDPDQAQKIFKLFARLHNQKDYKGTGIGLALCKKIIENHKGFIHATSRKGVGSSFHIYLPVM
jgi:signal transduction histidine kinase